MKSRFFWADVIRVIAIYFVVLIHNSSFPKELLISNLPLFLIQAISRISIPLFIMLSGALLLGKKENYSSFFKKRFLKVFFPWIAWTLIYVFWSIYIKDNKVNSIKDLKYIFEVALFTNLWFLPLISFIYLLTPLWNKFIESSKKQDRIYLLIIMFAFSSIVPFFHNGPTFPLDQGGIFTKAFQYSTYFLAGYILIKDKFFNKKLYIYLFLFIAGILLTIIQTYNIKPLEQAYSYLSPNIAVLTIAIFAFIYKYFENKKIPQNFKRLFEKMSLASLGVYILHQPVMYVLNPYLLGLRNFLSEISEVISGIIMALIYFLITTLIVYLLQKTPMKKILP